MASNSGDIRGNEKGRQAFAVPAQKKPQRKVYTIGTQKPTTALPSSPLQHIQSRTQQARAAETQADMLSLVMEPLTLSQFLTLVDALRVYPFDFPDRSEFVAAMVRGTESPLGASNNNCPRHR